MNRLLFTAALCCLFGLSLPAQIAVPDSVAATHFNFWIGEWDVYRWDTDQLVGQSRIEAILGGTAIQEHYSSTTNPYSGTSLSKWNPRLQQWEQYWIDVTGLTLHIQGGLTDGKMMMGNAVTSPQGLLQNRIIWEALPDNKGVRQIWEQSTGTSEWVRVFDGHYVRKE